MLTIAMRLITLRLLQIVAFPLQASSYSLYTHTLNDCITTNIVQVFSESASTKFYF